MSRITGMFNGQMNKLSLDPRRRFGTNNTTERDWLEFLIDGLGLHDKLPGDDFISPLGWGLPSEEMLAIDQLLLKKPSELRSGRVPLYVCPECGDLGCGAVTAVVRREGDSIVWEDFGYENNYEEAIDRRGYEKHGPFRFIYSVYEELLDDRRKQLAG